MPGKLMVTNVFAAAVTRKIITSYNCIKILFSFTYRDPNLNRGHSTQNNAKTTFILKKQTDFSCSRSETF